MSFKPRSRYGQFLDDNGVLQERVREDSKVSRETLRRICNDDNEIPSGTTAKKLIDSARKLTGKSVNFNDFWPM